MKPQFIIILLILVGILGFIVGYSIAPTDVSVVRHSEPQATTSSSGGHEASGGYSSAPESGGYGEEAPAASGGYGTSAPAAGGYGAPASGGYGH